MNGEMGEECSMHARGKWEMHKNFWSEDLKRGDHLEHLGRDVRMVLMWILWKWSGNVWTGCILL